MERLTSRQEKILRWIGEFLEERGFPPTRAEIARGLGFRSANAAEEHLKALERKGAVELLPGASRGIRLAAHRSGVPPRTLPLVGRVPAGAPILAEENIEDRYEVDPRLFSPRPDYLLRVVGESMRDAGILDGDLLAVHRTPEASDGRIVVARLDGEVTVKRLRWRGDEIRLLPENPAFAPIVVDPDRTDFSIEGIGVGLLRRGGKP
ncbi:MAG: transcriptional repressor LexA [Verrucomicrobiota bacterium]